MELAQFLSSGIGVAIIIFVVLWAILWLFMPFYISGINNKLKLANKKHDDRLKASNKTNLLLENLIDEIEKWDK
ncbi:MAG: hypothetical protein GY928_22245 [Colwellia sp.]|nr:hypothetical protein [Colwellia sp.]